MQEKRRKKRHHHHHHADRGDGGRERERETEKTEWRSLWSENDCRCAWNQKKDVGMDGWIEDGKR